MNGGYIYAGNHSPSGVLVIDGRNASAPLIGDVVPLPDGAVGATLDGSWLYLILGNGSLAILDVSEPSRPQLVGQLAGLRLRAPITHVGQYVLCSAGGMSSRPDQPLEYVKLMVIDVVDPEHPRVIGSADLPYNSSPHDPTQFLSLAATNGYVLATTGSIYGLGGTGLVVFDIRSPSRPSKVTRVTLSNSGPLALYRERAFVFSYGTVDVFDVSQPVSPTLEVSLLCTGCSSGAFRPSVIDDHAYVAEAGGLHVIGLGGSAGPSVAGSYFSFRAAEALYPFENHLYATSTDGSFWAFDMTNVEHPRVVGRLAGDFFDSRMEVIGDVAYVACNSKGLRLVDVHDSALPTLLAVISSIPFPADLAVVGDRLFVKARDGLHVLDVDDPRQPREIARLDFGGEPIRVRVRGDLAYVSLKDGLRIFDIHDTKAVREVGYLPMTTSWLIGLMDNIAVLQAWASVDDGLRFVDISDPMHPRLVGSSDFAAHIRGIDVADGHVFLGIEQNLVIIDARDPRVPTQVLAAPLQEDASNIRVDGRLVYVASWYAGLTVFHFEPGPPPIGTTPTPTTTPTSTPTIMSPTPTSVTLPSKWRCWLPVLTRNTQTLLPLD